MPIVSINRIDLYYEEYKNNTSENAIVLLHGFLSSTFSFRKLVPLLNPFYNVISIDLPPFGKSGKNQRFQYSYHYLGITIIKLIQSLGYKKLILVGHSMGGQIALNIMLQRPDIVNKGVLLCSSGYLEPSKPSLRLLSYIPFFHYYVKYFLGKTGVQKNVENVVFDHSLIDSEMLRGYEEPFLDNEIFKGLTKMIRDREGDLTSERLHSIKTPCLLLWGEHDRVVPLKIGEKLANDLPNSKLIVLKNAGHLIPEEKPVEVFQYIQDYLQ